MAEDEDKPIQPCDAYRSFSAVLEPDVRGVGVFHTIDLKNWQKYVNEQLGVEPYLPFDLRIQLETVKNLFLYAWFVYRFGVVGKTQALNTLELALKIKFKREGLNSPNGLSRKLEKALAEGWFDDSSFHHITSKPNSKEKSSVIIRGIIGIRNDLNHGSTMLIDPLNLIENVRVCFNIIHALFDSDEEHTEHTDNKNICV